MKFRKKPVEIHATQWFKNGDHPDDYRSDRPCTDAAGVATMKSGEFFREQGWEGEVVRYYRRPSDPGARECEHCQLTMHVHGWIDTLEGGHIVCPGDWIVTGVRGEKYPVKDQIFKETYEPVEET